MKKNEFESFCDELAGGQVNKVDYVREQLRAKYKDNLDMLLMIKAEAQEDDYMQYSALRLSVLAFICSVFSVMSNYTPKTGNELVDLGINMIYLLLLVYAFIKIGKIDPFTSVCKWRKYVLVVIDELIEESKYKETEKVVKESKKKRRNHKKGKNK